MSQNPSMPQEPGRPSAYDDQLRARALANIKRRNEFWQNATSYAVVNGFLVLLWFFTGAGYFWPIWPILGWGVGLVFHALSLRWADEPKVSRIDSETERLRRRDEARGIGPSSGTTASGPAVPGPAVPGPWDRSPGPQDTH